MCIYSGTLKKINILKNYLPEENTSSNRKLDYGNNVCYLYVSCTLDFSPFRMNPSNSKAGVKQTVDLSTYGSFLGFKQPFEHYVSFPRKDPPFFTIHTKDRIRPLIRFRENKDQFQLP